MKNVKKGFLRRAGVLMPVSSLPSKYGIGTFGKEGYKFVDFLAKADMKYWQVLPLGPTSYGDSPYQSPSAFAGNPYFIDIEGLIKDKLLTKKEADAAYLGSNPMYVDYAAQYENRYPLLYKAYDRWVKNIPEDFEAFVKKEKWLPDFALFMALKKHFNQAEWIKWDEDIRFRKPAAVKRYKTELAYEIGFQEFLQYKFFKEWKALKAYANGKGIEIIGDMPIYVSYDSADVWTNTKLFRLDETLHQTEVAGCPPDCFSEDGQKWGNPLYDWKAHEAEGFKWFKKRMAGLARLYDVIRIDHFIGVVRYYCVPYDKTAKYGWYEDGPAMKLVDAINEAIGKSKIIAEDLGVYMPEVEAVLNESGFPGMKLLAFAFDSDSENSHLAHFFKKNMVAYIGTHDNETLAGQLETMKPKQVKYMMDYIGASDKADIREKMFKCLYRSVADTVILQMQDVLGLDNRARINLPSTLGNNWHWRMLAGEVTSAQARELAGLAKIYGRSNN